MVPPRKRVRAARNRAKTASPALTPVLGNDPFEKGAATRPRAVLPVADLGPATPPLGDAPSIESPVEEPRPDPVSVATAPSAPASPGPAEASDGGETQGSPLPSLIDKLSDFVALRALLRGDVEREPPKPGRVVEECARPILHFLYDAWWRVEAREIERVPSHGPVVLVANRGGSLPWDALIIRHAVGHHHSARRDVLPLLRAEDLRAPVVGPLVSRLGAAPASPERALEVLRAAGVVAVFPEKRRAAARTWDERYRVEQLGRGGFVRLALLTGATIVPCAIVGSEETSAPLAREGWLSERLGITQPGAFPVGAPLRALQALGWFPLPARWSIRFGDAIETRDDDPDLANDPSFVEQTTATVRAAIQRMLDDDIAARQRVYL